jgi:tRNA A-37 threonylcarbamoyl transferase component Bud32
VAVKLLRAELATDEQFVSRFEKEAAALATLRHPNIVSIVDRGRSAASYYLVMEFVDGPSLRERMREPDFDATKTIVTMLQVTRAIDYAHNRGVIHRDLKPENILFDDQAGQLPKVTDFGLAGLDERHADSPRHLTQTHVSMGTASYMAPEQAVDARSVGPRADIYSLGVMLYELLTGELPRGTFTMPSVLKAGLDKRLDGIISRCLKPAPEDRYPTAGALLADLEKLVQYTSLPSLSRETPLQLGLRRAREVSLRVGRWLALGVVMFALAILSTVFLRARATADRPSSGVALMTDFGVRTPLNTPGRADKVTRILSLGEGPDTITVMSLGRPARLEQGALVYDADRKVPSGRAVIDAELAGTGLELSVLVDTQQSTPSLLEPLYALFRGPRPDARSALMLEGEHGRYVALVISGSGSEPTLEWALGPDKRGLMQAPLPTTGLHQRLTLRVDAETGTLFAIVGEGRDARILGDGLWLGPAWRQVVGDSPRLALGCLEGTCAFREVRATGIEVPSGLSPPAFPPEDALPSTGAEPTGGKKPAHPKPANRPVQVKGQAAPPPVVKSQLPAPAVKKLEKPDARPAAPVLKKK